MTYVKALLRLNSKLNMLSNELCRSIIAMNSHITLVAIINEKGTADESQGCNCIIEKLPSTRKEMFFMENALMHRMRKEFDLDLGQVRFTYVERAERGLFSFPMYDQLLLVSFLRTHVNSLTLAGSIEPLVDRYKKELENMSQVLA
ncbi:MAG: hypothetical protein KGH83_04135 [Thaumarchaeota archaeon]|nr:hypothetical protein [Nitrososphaerota archaeon]